MTKKTKVIIGIAAAFALIMTGAIAFLFIGKSNSIVIDGKFKSGSTIEYTGEDIQFPVAHVEDRMGKIISYDVNYQIVNLEDDTKVEDPYATFNLKTGKYELIYTYNKHKSVSKKVKFSVKDTISPTIAFSEVPNGLFLQDIQKEEILKLPGYTLEDASMDDGVELEKTLYFKADGDKDYKEYDYRDINSTYTVEKCGKFKYELIATDVYGNSTTEAAEWKIKDRDWKPSTLPPAGYLADYSEEGYTNTIEGGDVNQYYKIGNDYTDKFLEEYKGAKGVFKINMGFNSAAGSGYNTIKLRFANTFTQEEIKGKYLAVRIYVKGKNLEDEILFGGNNVAFREEDQTTRAFSTSVAGLETGVWKTYYIDADTVQHIGVYPNAQYNPTTTFYEGGDAANCLQLCFHRKAGYSNRMTLYIDSITLAEKLPETDITIQGDKASWTAVEKASGYSVEINDQEAQLTKETEYPLPGKKGYLEVTPKGDGALTLDAESSVSVYGLDTEGKLALFNDELYVKLFSDRLNFSTEAEHAGYKPKSYKANLTQDGVELQLGTGGWGVVTGIKFTLPHAQAKGSNTTLVMNLNISHAKYGSMRVYDTAGNLLQNVKLDGANTGAMHRFEIDLDGYDKVLKGVQLVFGPNAMNTIDEGVKVTFKDMYFENTYYDIVIDGKTYTCVGKRELNPGYTTDEVVQFTEMADFGVPTDDTPLNFQGTVLLDGKKLGKSGFTVVGYPNNKAICFKVKHKGKVLTIQEGSTIYYGNKAVVVGKTFNARWNGSSWENLANIPPEPAKEYITINGIRKEVADRVELEPGYTTKDLVQFTNVNDFGVSKDDTPLLFEGVVMLDGQKVNNVKFVGYPDNMTICLKVPHNGKLLTILGGSVIHYGEQAVVVKKTFNAKWNGAGWVAVSDVPAVPKDEYITVNDKKLQVMNRMELTPGYTQKDLVQFLDVNDFDVNADDTPLNFQGTVMVDGEKVNDVNFVGYKKNTTICLKVPHNGKLLTILKDSVIYGSKEAVVVKKTFNMKWDEGTNKWVAVSNVPAVPEDEYVTVDDSKKLVVGKVELEPHYTADVLVQFGNVYNFGLTEEQAQLGFSGKVLLDGAELSADAFRVEGYKGSNTICLYANHSGKVLTVMKDSVIYYGNKAVVVKKTFNAKWDQATNTWKAVADIPTPPEPSEPEGPATLELAYRWGANNVLQMNTNLPSSTPCVNFLATDNGCEIDQSANEYQQVGWVGMDNVDGTIVLTLHFNAAFENGQTYILKKDSIFGFTDGKKYKLDKDCVFTWDGSAWMMSNELPAEPSEPEGPAVLELAYRWGANNVLQMNTNLPSSTPCVNFLAEDNGCEIDQSANTYQRFGWAGMDNVDGTIVLTLHFNAAFENGQTYILKKNSIFGFTDGKKYKLDKDYVFTWDGSAWTMSNELPAEPSEPEGPAVLELAYRWGANNVLQMNTSLPSSTPCVNFLAEDNGCEIDQSANTYQRFGWAGMDNVDGMIVLTLHFNAAFENGQTYVLKKDSIFGFTDGKKYKLDKDYVFTWDGSAWTMSNLPAEPGVLELAYRWGANNLIQVNTNLPSSTPLVNFTAGDNGCNIDQSVNAYQQFGWIGMDNVNEMIVLTLHFNEAFENGQTYILKKDSIFGFTDGKKYKLDKDYVFTHGGSGWTMSNELVMDRTRR